MLSPAGTFLCRRVLCLLSRSVSRAFVGAWPRSQGRDQGSDPAVDINRVALRGLTPNRGTISTQPLKWGCMDQGNNALFCNRFISSSHLLGCALVPVPACDATHIRCAWERRLPGSRVDLAEPLGCYAISWLGQAILSASVGSRAGCRATEEVAHSESSVHSTKRRVNPFALNEYELHTTEFRSSNRIDTKY